MKNWSKKFPTVLFAITGVILLAVMIKILTGPQSEPAAAGPAWVEKSIQELEAGLADATNPTEEAFIQGKLEQLRNIQANSLQAQENAPEKPADICALRPTPLPTADRIPGVERFEPELFEQFDLIVNSRWQGEVNGQWMAILAGISGEDVQQGVLLVLVQNTDDRALISAPQPGGALQIQAADGVRLTLIDDNGTQYLFDAAARAFLNSPDEILPTLAPQPTYTPTAEICPP
ncbi:MAG: hypothetical protein ACYC11_00445 [Bellilinea sp.]